MVPGLQRVEFHRDLHGVTNPKSPNGGINREGAATQRRTSGTSQGIWGPQSLWGLELSHLLPSASQHQATQQQGENRTHRIRNTATTTSEELQPSEDHTEQSDLFSPYSASRFASPQRVPGVRLLARQSEDCF